MKLIFFIVIVSQILNLLSVFAEKFKQDSSDVGRIKWEKLEDKNSNNLKKIIWKSYKNDESYFHQNKEEKLKDNNSNNSEKIIWKTYKNDESYFQQNSEEKFNLKNTKNSIEENNFQSQKRPVDTRTEIEPYLPLNNFLDYGQSQISVRWKSSFDGGVSSGSGQQNPSFIFDYGISDSSLFSIYFSEADDDLYNLIDGKRSNYHWQNFAFSFKRKLLDIKDNILGASLVSTVEYWRHSSGSINTKSIYNPNASEFSKDKFENIVGSLSLPLTKNYNDNLNFFVVPGITVLPKKLISNGISTNVYGNNFYLGSGLIFDISEDIDMHFSYTIPFGPGNNYFDSELNYSRKPIYSFGFGWNINPKIGVQGKITNSYGSSPSTGLLTIPSDNKPLYSANIIYKPFEEDTFLKPLDRRNKLISHGGITNSNALIPKYGTSQFSINYDSKGNWFGSYGYSLSNIFQLELLNIGSFGDINLVSDKNKALSNNYLNDNNLNYRLGGKFLILSPQKDDPLWLALRTSLGRNHDTNQGYLFSELINTFRFNDWLALNISPKYLISGSQSYAGIGMSSYVSLFDNLMFIPEINNSFINSSDFNSSFALRYSYKPWSSFDLYYSNSAGIQDIGQMFEEKEFRYGIKFNFQY
tara:strand:+ start:997 stop:2913 length:1917 start_codon:yes stop_codon:yes gene_type:complete